MASHRYFGIGYLRIWREPIRIKKKLLVIVIRLAQFIPANMGTSKLVFREKLTVASRQAPLDANQEVVDGIRSKSFNPTLPTATKQLHYRSDDSRCVVYVPLFGTESTPSTDYMCAYAEWTQNANSIFYEFRFCCRHRCVVAKATKTITKKKQPQ